ncbi:hypothetical protein BKA59DRAFT_560199 [Fusarium tricinctum]|uniref:CFEM domain-containing protein n=1 Tax=Fusarium tricinctum TaxID=61284 RepID=A0A8K0RNN8_9HYPO|nr:hypothetical protein BKA59DRAFT_560199 [Fusarium tricinctum]
MKSFTFIATTFLSASALAQSMGGSVLPECAQQCALQAIQASNCQSADPSCVCKSANFASDFTKCVGSNCSPAESTAAIATGLQLCAAAGVSIVPMSGMSGMPSVTAGGPMSMPSAPVSAPSAPASAPVVPPPVIPSQPVVPPSPVTTPTAAGPVPVPATPVPATPVATAGVGTPISHNSGLAPVGLALVSTMFLFLFM